MASAAATFTSPVALLQYKISPKSSIFSVTVRRSGARRSIKASGEISNSIVKSVQNAWENPEDRLALFGLGFAGVAAFWASINVVSAIDKLPLVPNFLEFVGILYSSWFLYRYILFKANREEIAGTLQKSISDVMSQ